MIKNKYKNNVRTFKEKIIISNIIMGGIIFFYIIIFIGMNTVYVDKYKETTITLKSMNSFYESVSASNSYVKDYLYTENKESLLHYKKEIKKAYLDVKILKDSSNVTNYYRFVMLERMLESYEQICQNLVVCFELKEDYLKAYNQFLEAENLIAKTSDNYYSLITKEVSEQLDSLISLRNSTILASILLLILLLIWLLYYSNRLSTSITKPINLLLKNISKIKEGKYDLSQVSGTSQEMEELCNAMNDMAYAIQSNMEFTQEKAKLEKQLLEWENENLRKDELLTQSELKMLQNQMNPHFLFNTLNMIYKLAIQEGADNAADILIKTSQLLRYGLDKQSKLSDIKSEVEMLKNYILIQEIRLGDRVHFDLCFENEKEIGSFAIPGMILQPLVENAIKHGLKDCLKDGEVEIYVRGNKDIVVISVGDNGIGMRSEELERFVLNDYQKESGNHLGLYNVVKRLQMYHDKNVLVNINSDLDCGFEIVVEITR